MERVITLIMHGAPPRDFPRAEMGEFFSLSSRLRQPAGGPDRAAMEARRNELEARMRAWPRNAQNDPFHAASLDMAEELRRAAGTEVVLGFGEFCAPSMEEALDSAASMAAEVVVVTVMMTRGGEHSESDIPNAVREAQARHPETRYVYVWPYETPQVAAFVATQIERFTTSQT